MSSNKKPSKKSMKDALRSSLEKEERSISDRFAKVGEILSKFAALTGIVNDRSSADKINEFIQPLNEELLLKLIRSPNQKIRCPM